MISLLPKLPPHRPSAAVKAAYQDKVAKFCATLLEVRSRLDFDVGSRGWAYILEGERFIDKDEIDAAQALINNCRKSGDLPLDICAEDDKRAAENLEQIDPAPRDEARGIFEYVKTAQESYTPFSFWDDLDTYVQVATEKSNIKNLFLKPCAEFCVPIANIGGWADLNVRAGFMRRFRQKEAEGKRCVLLSFTDHDPGGLHISDFMHSNLEDMARWWAGHRVISSSTVSGSITISSSVKSLRGSRTWPRQRANTRSTTSGTRITTSPTSRTTCASTVCGRLSLTRCSRCRNSGADSAEKRS